MAESDDMSWRKFKVLLRGLSANSALAISLRNKGDGEGEPIEDEEGRVLSAL